MLKNIKMLFSLMVAIVTISTTTACSQATPQEQVRETINEMIAALENGDKALIFEQYAYIPAGSSTELSDFSDRHASKLLKYLKLTEGTTPSMSDNNTTATVVAFYDADEEGVSTVSSGRQTLTFTKVDGQWKLNN